MEFVASRCLFNQHWPRRSYNALERNTLWDPTLPRWSESMLLSCSRSLDSISESNRWGSNSLHSWLRTISLSSTHTSKGFIATFGSLMRFYSNHSLGKTLHGFKGCAVLLKKTINITSTCSLWKPRWYSFPRKNQINPIRSSTWKDLTLKKLMKRASLDLLSSTEMEFTRKRNSTLSQSNCVMTGCLTYNNTSQTVCTIATLSWTR